MTALCAALAGCVVDDPGWTLPDLDREYFDRAVVPVLARRCAFADCHGNSQRFFSVYARGRHRLPGVDVEGRPIGIMSEITRRELDLDYDRARGFVDAEHPERSQLLTKPLAEDAGGLYHRAADLYGADLDVFLDRQDPDYRTLVRWVFGGAVCDADGENACEVTLEQVPVE